MSLDCFEGGCSKNNKLPTESAMFYHTHCNRFGGPARLPSYATIMSVIVPTVAVPSCAKLP